MDEPLATEAETPLKRRGLLILMVVTALAALAVGVWWTGRSESQLERLEALIDRGEGEAAELAIARMNRDEPERRHEVYYLEGYLALARGRPAVAARLYHRAVVAAEDRHPRHQAILSQMAALTESEDCQAALEAARTLGALDDPEADAALRGLADRGVDDPRCNLAAVAREALGGPPAPGPPPAAPVVGPASGRGDAGSRVPAVPPREVRPGRRDHGH